MINVTVENFEAEVINASMTTPVLVDFWAPWCGPCKVIGPILEKLETEYDGRFKLVKIDSDQQQELAGAFGVRSIPTCILLSGGRPVDGFTGALPEGKLREFLDKHLPSGDELEAEAGAEEAEALADAGDNAAALEKLGQALALNPGNDDARFDYIKLLIAEGQLEHAHAALEPALAREPRPSRFEALRIWLDAVLFVANTVQDSVTLEEFDEKIAANKRDFDARHAKARILLARGDWTAAMDELLEIVMRDKKWNDEAPRKTIVAILELMSPPKPKAEAAAGGAAGKIALSAKSAAEEDPQQALVSRYRRQLSMMLN
ncbi:MAG: thioredoxin [Burkholderiales bacterium]